MTSRRKLEEVLVKCFEVINDSRFRLSRKEHSINELFQTLSKFQPDKIKCSQTDWNKEETIIIALTKEQTISFKGTLNDWNVSSGTLRFSVHNMEEFRRCVKQLVNNEIVNPTNTLIISSPGYYELDENVITIDNEGPAIIIDANKVSLDLKGFTVEAGTSVGIKINNGLHDIQISNGVIKNCQPYGLITGEHVTGLVLTDLVFANNGSNRPQPLPNSSGGFFLNCNKGVRLQRLTTRRNIMNGGVLHACCQVRVEDCHFDDNIGGQGSDSWSDQPGALSNGLYLSGRGGTDIIIKHCTFNHNQGTLQARGLAVLDERRPFDEPPTAPNVFFSALTGLTITDCQFVGNNVGQGGYNADGLSVGWCCGVNITRCQARHNINNNTLTKQEFVATKRNGSYANGMSFFQVSSLRLEHCTIDSHYGGAYFNTGLRLRQCHNFVVRSNHISHILATVTGADAMGIFLRNDIGISSPSWGSCNGVLDNNIIINIIGLGVMSAGILLASGDNVMLQHNIITDANDGILLLDESISSTNHCVVGYNRINHCTAHGIRDQTNGKDTCYLANQVYRSGTNYHDLPVGTSIQHWSLGAPAGPSSSSLDNLSVESSS